MRRLIFPCLIAALSLALLPALAAQQPGLPDAPQPGDESHEPTLRNLPRNFLHDQAAIWTSPIHLRGDNIAGPLLLVGATTLLATTDHQVMSKHFLDPTRTKHANTASTGLTGLMAGGPGVIYLVGRFKQDPVAEQTGVLAGEAMLDSLAVNEAFKILSRRERPTLDGARGKWFQPGVGFESSFASNHSVLAWSSAAVIASEYDSALTKITVYTLATGVSLTRVVGRDHFPSDVLAGSAVGWMIGRYVDRRHRRNELASGRPRRDGPLMAVLSHIE